MRYDFTDYYDTSLTSLNVGNEPIRVVARVPCKRVGMAYYLIMTPAVIVRERMIMYANRFIECYPDAHPEYTRG